MPLTIVSIAYPVIPISCDTVGGTEQVVAMLDEALVAAGHRSIVVASESSMVAGKLVATPSSMPRGPEEWAKAYSVHQEAVRRVLREHHVDVVHMHGIDFHKYLPESEVPVLATFHLPAFNYPREALYVERPLTFLSCVSRFARRQYPEDVEMEVIPNGVRLDRFRPGPAKEGFVLALGRVCPEKGFHLALDAAKRSGRSLLLAGMVHDFPENRAYFEKEIQPRLDDERRFLGPVPMPERIDLLARAACLVIPSLVPETGSLVVAEALASGTPVVARRVGALPEMIEDGRTGILADDVEEMAQAFEDCGRIQPAECREVAVSRYSMERMARSYFALYEKLAAMARPGRT
jgi:glycosyltransferase involved in cell wall biosynthesis